MITDGHPAVGADVEDVRLDKWLWAARLFKTRALAAAAVEGGKVHVNGVRAKPSRHVHPGDEIRVRRGPAPRAQTLYAETADSQAAHAARVEQRRQQGPEISSKRPDKKGRRQIHRFLRGE